MWWCCWGCWLWAPTFFDRQTLARHDLSCDSNGRQGTGHLCGYWHHICGRLGLHEPLRGNWFPDLIPTTLCLEVNLWRVTFRWGLVWATEWHSIYERCCQLAWAEGCSIQLLPFSRQAQWPFYKSGWLLWEGVSESLWNGVHILVDTKGIFQVSLKLTVVCKPFQFC